MVKIYTKTGDDGSTGLIGGMRVFKNAERLDAYGTIDELNAAIGFAISQKIDGEIASSLQNIQNQLFVIGAELSTAEESVRQQYDIHFPQTHVTCLEKTIDRFADLLPPLNQFILPGGSPSASALHIARTVCRRAERKIVALNQHEPVNHVIIQYINRLSDLLFVLARYQNKIEDVKETVWKKENKE